MLRAVMSTRRANSSMVMSTALALVVYGHNRYGCFRNSSRRGPTMTLSQNVQFAGSLVKPLDNAARINTVSGIRARWHSHRSPISAETTAYDPLDPATAAQPHESYRRLHPGAPPHHNPKRSISILTPLDDLRAAARAGAAPPRP